MKNADLLKRIEELERRIERLELVDAIGRAPQYVPVVVPYQPAPYQPSTPVYPWGSPWITSGSFTSSGVVPSN